MFDRNRRLLLSEGEYELALREQCHSTKNYSPKKHPSWEVLPEQASIETVDAVATAFGDFKKSPTLKFHLTWTKEKAASYIERPMLLDIKTEKDNKPDQNQNHNGVVSLALPDNQQLQPIVPQTDVEQVKVNYLFIYHNSSRQQTEACLDYTCPWCRRNCECLYSLLKHLKLDHARFNFTYVPAYTPARIEVSINDLYDGSYTGAPHDLIHPSGIAFSRAGPVKRTTVTRILVCRPRRTKPNLSEFLEIDENELNSQRPYITGHNRYGKRNKNTLSEMKTEREHFFICLFLT